VESTFLAGDMVQKCRESCCYMSYSMNSNRTFYLYTFLKDLKCSNLLRNEHLFKHFHEVDIFNLKKMEQLSFRFTAALCFIPVRFLYRHLPFNDIALC